MLIILMLYQLTLCYAGPYQEDWEKYKATYGKNYKTKEEENRRREIFYENMNIINKHNVEFNAGLASFEMAMNQYGDMAQDEFERIMLGVERADYSGDETEMQQNFTNERKSFFESLEIKGLEMKKAKQALSFLRRLFYKMYDKAIVRLGRLVEAEESWDPKKSANWLDEGAVTPARDQGSCGSCWAFCILGSLESHLFIKYGNLTPLSVQQLVDCTNDNSTHGNQGCDGGNMRLSLEYIWENGIALEKDYPYEEKESTCKYEKKMSAGTCKAYNELEGEDDIKYVVSERGPLCSVMDASTIEFRFYKSGYYKSYQCSSEGTNHAVLVVGYGEAEEGGYWLIKNSWGPSWGQNGTAKVSRARSCGINIYGIYPVV